MELANDVMQDILSERFNWKFNSKRGAPFYTNSFQQDYPMPGTQDIAWLETAERVDINSTQIPQPAIPITVRKQLPRTSRSYRPVQEVCWDYNKDLVKGKAWPGANVVIQPWISTAPVANNPILNFVDANGNILVVTTPGTTGSTAPAAAAGSVDGTTVTDGTVVWTVADPLSQGFRVDQLPSGSGPVYQITPVYQVIAPIFVTSVSLNKQTIAPIPDDKAKVFRRGYAIACKGASVSANDRQEALREHGLWIEEMLSLAKQGDRELDYYALIPATSVVEEVYTGYRNPMDPGTPY